MQTQTAERNSAAGAFGERYNGEERAMASRAADVAIRIPVNGQDLSPEQCQAHKPRQG